MLRRYKLIPLFVLIVILLSGCGGTVSPEKTSDDSTPAKQSESATQTESKPDGEQKAAKAQTFKIGDAISIGDYVFTVNSARTSKGGDFLKPDEGNIWYIVDATVENESDKPVTISSMMMFKLSDSEGYNYNSTIADDTKGNLDGELAPGRKMRGELAFEIPENAGGLELIFDADVWGSGQAIVKLDR